MQQFRDDEVYVLSPGVRLRRDSSFVLMSIQSRRTGSHEGRIRQLTPQMAVFLALLDGSRTFARALQDFSYVLDVKAGDTHLRSAVVRFLQQLKEFSEDFLVVANPRAIELAPKYDPLRFVIPREEIHLGPVERLDLPVAVDLALNVTCNRRCVYCYADRDAYLPKVLTPDDWCRLISDAAELEIPAVGLTGADALLEPWLPDVAGHAVRNGYHPLLSTKQLVGKRMARALAEAGIRRVQVSIDSARADTADRLVGVRGYLGIATRSIRNLLEAGVDVAVKAVLTAWNIRHVADLLELLHGFGVRDVLLDSYGRSLFRHRDELFPSKDDVLAAMAAVQAFRERHPEMRILGGASPREEPDAEARRRAWEAKAACSTARSAMAILPDGSVPVCFFCPLEDPFILARHGRDVTIRDTWNDPGMTAFWHPEDDALDEPCRSCPERGECFRNGRRCLRNVYMATGGTRGPDPACPRAGIPPLRLA